MPTKHTDANRLGVVRRSRRAHQIVVGFDNVQDVGAAEFDNLASLDVFTNAELLRLWSETTPQAIFSKRRIGPLAEGYEGSFVVLARNPLDDLTATHEIVRRFKHVRRDSRISNFEERLRDTNLFRELSASAAGLDGQDYQLRANANVSEPQPAERIDPSAR